MSGSVAYGRLNWQRLGEGNAMMTSTAIKIMMKTMATTMMRTMTKTMIMLRQLSSSLCALVVHCLIGNGAIETDGALRKMFQCHEMIR